MPAGRAEDRRIARETVNEIYNRGCNDVEHDTVAPRGLFPLAAPFFPVDGAGLKISRMPATMIRRAMPKYRPLGEIRTDLDACRALLEDLQTHSDAACSAYDLSLGYDAEWYLRSSAIENQIRYFEQELAAATPRQQPLF